MNCFFLLPMNSYNFDKLNTLSLDELISLKREFEESDNKLEELRVEYQIKKLKGDYLKAAKILENILNLLIEEYKNWKIDWKGYNNETSIFLTELVNLSWMEKRKLRKLKILRILRRFEKTVYNFRKDRISKEQKKLNLEKLIALEKKWREKGDVLKELGIQYAIHRLEGNNKKAAKILEKIWECFYEKYSKGEIEYTTCRNLATTIWIRIDKFDKKIGYSFLKKASKKLNLYPQILQQ